MALDILKNHFGDSMQFNKEDFFLARMDEGKQIYAILNAAANPEIPRKLWWLNAEYVSLYKGDPEEKYVDIAPYIVSFSINGEKHEALMEWIFKECWGRENAVFFESNSDIHTLLRHFQRFTIVIDESGKGMFFRFYDLRILRAYLPLCSASESQYVFGSHISCFFMEDEDGFELLTFLPKERLREDEIALPKMLTIRKEQIDFFKEKMPRKFAKRVLNHLMDVFPDQCEPLGESKISEIIWQGIDKANGYHLSTERDIARYIDLMILLGRDFDMALPWANNILTDKNIKKSTVKLDELFDYMKLREKNNA